MKLHLVDYHLEAARVLFAERELAGEGPAADSGQDRKTAREHIREAGELIGETGYFRRKGELEKLQGFI